MVDTKMTDVISLPTRRGRKVAQSAPPGGWAADLMADDRGRVVPNLANTMTALRGALELCEVFAYVEMLCAPILNEMAPGSHDGDTPRPLRDTDVTSHQEWLQRAGLPKVGREVVHQAADLRARERAFHPVRLYLENICCGGTADDVTLPSTT